jgi:hypothetical protein
MAGVTATISVQSFRRDWAKGLTIADICQRHTITKDQAIRLRTVWRCRLRLDRRKRAKPDREPEPTPEEEAASQASCDLAPAVSARAAIERESWCDVTYLLRSGACHAAPYTVPSGITLPEYDE